MPSLFYNSMFNAVLSKYDEYKDIITRPGNYTASVEFTNGTYYDYQANFTTFEVKKLNTTIAVSGKIDIITNGESIYFIDNGEEIMSKITGSGCMLSCVIGSFAAVSEPLEAAIIGTLSMTIAGELAYKTCTYNKQGSGSFRTYLIDELYNMDENKIIKYGKLYKGSQVNDI